jgi:hypothetical protein
MIIQLEIHDADNTIDGLFNPTRVDDFAIEKRPDTIRLERKSVDALIDILEDNGRKDLGLLPPAIRWISDSQRVVVFERPPSVQLVDIAMARRDDIHYFTDVGHYSLPIPWTVYYVLFDEYFNPVMIQVFCRNEPITDWSSRLFMLPMLNLYFDSSLCNPIFEKFEPCENLAEGVQSAYNMVWNSGWNLDLIDTVTYCMSKGIPSAPSGSKSIDSIINYFRSWEKMSILDILETEWMEPKMDVRGTDFEEDFNPTFRDTLDLFLERAGQQVGMNSKEMAIKIVNSFSLI